MQGTIVIYLIGKPGTGKYTIAQELAQFKYIVCDNHLINNPIFTIFNYDGFMEVPQLAWDAIKKIRNTVLDFMTITADYNYVLTNVLYELEEDHRLYEQVVQMAANRSSVFVPVKLIISEKEHLKRITQPSRKIRWKSVDPKYLHEPIPLINIFHPQLLELDVTNLSAQEATESILKHAATC